MLALIALDFIYFTIFPLKKIDWGISPTITCDICQKCYRCKVWAFITINAEFPCNECNAKNNLTFPDNNSIMNQLNTVP